MPLAIGGKKVSSNPNVDVPPNYMEHLAGGVKAKAPVGSVSVTKGLSPGLETSEELAPKQIIPLHRLAHVSVSAGTTINMGNYESVKIQVSVTVPCDKDDLDSTYEFGVSWVDEKMKKAMAEIKGV